MSAPFQEFPPLDAATEAALRAAIERYGVLVPVAKDQHGRILDGHHRVRIADGLGVRYRVDVVNVADDDEARAIARTLNADRRHLGAEQRRELVATLREDGHSVRAIAGALGASKSQINRDVEQLSRAGQLAQPDRVRGLDGKARPARRPTIVAAKNLREAERAQRALGVIGPGHRGGVLDARRAGRVARETDLARRRAAEAGISVAKGEWRLEHCAVAELEVADVDAIITDPPYEHAQMSVWGDLGAFAARALKPGRLLATYTGAMRLPNVLAALGDHLTYTFLGGVLVPGANAHVREVQFLEGVKPLLFFSAGPYQPRGWVRNLLTSEGPPADKLHRWQQGMAPFRDLVDMLTRPGELVVDPFLGSGTTAVAAVEAGRRFVGCDIDAACVSMTRERLEGA